MKRFVAQLLVVLLAAPATFADHREAPIVALDHKADITGVYAFRSYGAAAVPSVTLIMVVDGLQEPANGPNWWPFDHEILYELKVDNNNDAVEDIVFQFRFSNEQRRPDDIQAYSGVGAGIPPYLPPRITSFTSPGLGLRQSYSVTMIKGGITTPIVGAGPFYAVPANVGPRTMDYNALFNQAIYTTTTPNVKVFAGNVDDPVYQDMGGFHDTYNFRSAIAPGVLSNAQDAAYVNIASDTVSGFAANAIAIEVPVSTLTRTGAIEAATSTAATIGVWASTSRYRLTTRRAPLPNASSGSWSQVQRMGNPLINSMIITNASKDKFSLDVPKNDSQFQTTLLDPLFARITNGATAGAVTIPPAPRTDMLPLFVYSPPIAAVGTTAGPLADMLRLNTGVNGTVDASINRLGLIGGDVAGFPNGRRLQDDHLDIMMRIQLGVLNPAYNIFPNNRWADGVNVNDAPFRASFPYLANAPSGRDRRHIDSGEPGCTAGAGAPCVP